MPRTRTRPKRNAPRARLAGRAQELWQRSKGRLLTVALVLTSTAYALAENVTLTTYYPSPRGVYEELRLLVTDTVANNIKMFQATTNSNVNNVRMALQRARLAGAVPDNVIDGDILGAIRWEGLDTDDNPLTDFVAGAVLRAEVDGAPAANDMPTRLVFLTDPPGATTATERMRITSGGNVGIGTAAPAATLHVSGSVRLQTGAPAAGQFLTSTDTSGTVGWAASPVPVGAIMFFNGPCPAGWTEVTSAQGRYIVGVPVGGSVGGTAGVALANLEERNNVGFHGHVASVFDPGHSHINNETPWNTNRWLGGATNAITGGWSGVATCAGCIASATTGITVGIAPVGSAETNAPYVQLRACSKN